MARRKAGKIIEKWDFTIKGMKVTIPVRMITPKYTDQETKFVVDFEYGEHHFHQYETDISVLRRATKDWLKDVVTFEYDTYFQVIFHGGVKKPKKHEEGLFSEETIRDMNNKEIGEISTNMEWRRYQSGKTAAGQPMYRDCSKMLNHGDWVKGDLETGLKKRDIFADHQDSMTALILATPENEAALEQLADAFQALHDKLMKFLTPEQIEANFAKIISVVPLAMITS